MKTYSNNMKIKITLIVILVLLLATTFGVGFGIGLDETTPIVRVFEGKYWVASSESDPLDSTKKLETLTIKDVETEAQLEEAYKDMISKEVDLSSFNELILPYYLKSVLTEAKIKEVLHLETFEDDDIGYILHEADYVDTVATSGGYKNQKIVKVNLPKATETLPTDTFFNNKIRKVNWSDLTKLTSIGEGAFFRNRLTGNLDLSILTSLTSIGDSAFRLNIITGTLTLPSKLETIGNYSFFSVSDESTSGLKVNRIRGTLKLPKTLKSIGIEAFIYNNIEVLDWSEAEMLEDIKSNAFAHNQLKTLQFNATSPPKIKEIGEGTFIGNPGLNDNNEMFIDNFILPPSLQTIGEKAIKVRDGITITATPPATGITEASFDGTISITNPTT